MNIIKHKNIYFLISILVIIPGLISLFISGLKLSIDFTGGSRIEYKISAAKQDKVSREAGAKRPGSARQISNSEIEKVVENAGVEVSAVQNSGENTFIVRTKPLDQKTHQKITDAVKKKYVSVKENTFETVGPVIGSETTWNAVKAIIFSSVLIIFYIAWSFRKVPKPASSLRFGICAVVALIHDVLVVVGLFSFFGKIWNVEVDSLFITALLTVIGFSVHDTIVVFDRIRENLRRSPNAQFGEVVNDSILQTLARSLNTSFTVILVLFTMLLFGGETIKWFVVALLVGIISGTFSSIFNAAPLLVVWEEWSRKRKK